MVTLMEIESKRFVHAWIRTVTITKTATGITSIIEIHSDLGVF